MADDGAPGPDADRDAVIDSLKQKLTALDQVSSELVQAFAAATAGQRAQINTELEAVGYEQTACQNRIEDLTAQAPFTRPSAGDEQALADAIAAVGRYVNTSAAVNDVLKAADDLVTAYTARGTQAAGAG